MTKFRKVSSMFARFQSAQHVALSLVGALFFSAVLFSAAVPVVARAGPRPHHRDKKKETPPETPRGRVRP